MRNIFKCISVLYLFKYVYFYGVKFFNEMRKSTFSKILAFVFVASLAIPVSSTLVSCSKKAKFNKPRNGGKKVHSSGKVGNRRHRNSHVWGK